MALSLAVAVVAGGLLWFSASQPPADTVLRDAAPPGVSVVAPVPAAPAIPVIVANEAEIAVHSSDRPTVFRLAENPRILIIDYPNLREQGLALNRLAAFVEKAELPRDRVLDDPALAEAVARAGETIESYYFGHDYGAADLQRFFALADRDGVRLGPGEEFVRRLLRQEGILAAGGAGGLLSLPRVTEGVIDAQTRRVILRHELSHGEFFANPEYAAFVRRAWEDVLTQDQREAFVRFLTSFGYDRENHDLLVNEMQAFLMFTPGAGSVSARTLGLTEAALADLRQRFFEAMPAGWLRDLARAPLPEVR